MTDRTPEEIAVIAEWHGTGNTFVDSTEKPFLDVLKQNVTAVSLTHSTAQAILARHISNQTPLHAVG